MLIANILLLLSFLYLLFSVTEGEVYINKFSAELDNPVQLGLNSIGITVDAGNGFVGTHYIWILPVYIIVILAVILSIIGYLKARK